jgi:hypothetical protein
MENEKELTQENAKDVFTCTECRKKTTREEIRKIWTSIPFVKEAEKTYYCGCRGWD